RQSEAGRLFVTRASARSLDFELTADNAATLGHICKRLDGLPLALELVAARVASLGLEAIAARLDRQSVLRLGGWREAPARQQTLHATLEWSYERLSVHEQALLRRLAVFVGGFSEAGVQAVCSKDALTPEHAAECLARLVTRSLVVYDDTGNGRYRLLDT